MTNVAFHPCRAAGAAKTLKRKIATDRDKGIAELMAAIECLAGVTSEPMFGFAGDFIRECEAVLVELEALDPDDPPCFESVVMLKKKLDNIKTEFLGRIATAKQPLS